MGHIFPCQYHSNNGTRFPLSVPFQQWDTFSPVSTIPTMLHSHISCINQPWQLTASLNKSLTSSSQNDKHTTGSTRNAVNCVMLNVAFRFGITTDPQGYSIIIIIISGAGRDLRPTASPRTTDPHWRNANWQGAMQCSNCNLPHSYFDHKCHTDYPGTELRPHSSYPTATISRFVTSRCVPCRRLFNKFVSTLDVSVFEVDLQSKAGEVYTTGSLHNRKSTQPEACANCAALIFLSEACSTSHLVGSGGYFHGDKTAVT